MEQKAIALATSALISSGLVSDTKANTLAVHLSKGAKNWSIKELTSQYTERNQKEIQKCTSKLWTDYLAKCNYRFAHTDNGLAKVKTPLVLKQERLLDIKNQMIGETFVPPIKKVSKRLLDQARLKRFHEAVKRDIDNIENEMKGISRITKRLEVYFIPRLAYNPKIFIGTKDEYLPLPNVSKKKRILKRLLHLLNKRHTTKLEKIKERLTEVRKNAFERLVQIQRDIFINSPECWKRTERTSFLEKKHANEELKAEHIKLSEHMSSNLGDYMIETPKPFKNITIIPSEDERRANWKNPAFRSLYTSRMRSLVYAIRNNDKSRFLDRIKSGELKPNTFDTKEMWDLWYSEPKVEVKEKKPEEYDDGMFKCGKCKSMKTHYIEKQTRSADEPMTIFITCRMCGHVMKR
jgi:DNA-directed RNA polymerase subunit M/transcription elongation factor TFIIS